MPPNAIMFGRSVTKPSNGARMLQVVDIAARDLDRDARLVALLAQHRARGDRRLPVALDVDFELRESLAGFLEQQQVLLRQRRAPTSSLAVGIELGPPDLEARLEQRDLVVGGLRRGFGLGFGDLLLRELQVEGRLLERELLLGRIEFDDDVAAFHRGAVGDQLDDGHGAADWRHHERHRAQRPQITLGVDQHLYAPRRARAVGTSGALDPRSASTAAVAATASASTSAPANQRFTVCLPRPDPAAQSARPRADRTRWPPDRGRGAGP